MRVIAGSLRGRRLVAPRGEATRPTADRVRQALFDVLGDVAAAEVADLYAGTGALGIEALSRGAAHASFVEHAPAALAALRRNVGALGLAERANVIPLRIERARAALERRAPFRLVLCDPPWRLSLEVAPAVAKLLDGLLDPAGRVVLGCRASDAARLDPGPQLELVERRHWGDSAMSLYRPRR